MVDFLSRWRAVAAFATALLALDPATAALNRCTDPQGRVIFTDRPCAAGQAQMPMTAPGSSTAPAPAAASQAGTTPRVATGSTSWAGCYALESNDHIEIRYQAGEYFVRTGTDRGEEVRMVMRSATPEELRRVTWYPPVSVLNGLVSDHATVGTRIVKEYEGGTLPLLGMYRVADAEGRESLFGNFAFAIGPARKEACPGQRPLPPSPWAGCYQTRAGMEQRKTGPNEFFQVRQEGESLYIETDMEGTQPRSLVFKPATPADLNAFAAMVRATVKDPSIEVTSGLALYGTAHGTHYKPAENKGEPRMGFYRIRERGTESLSLFFLYMFDQVTKVPCAAIR
jgi:hypothetical protein